MEPRPRPTIVDLLGRNCLARAGYGMTGLILVTARHVRDWPISAFWWTAAAVDLWLHVMMFLLLVTCWLHIVGPAMWAETHARRRP